MNLLFFLLFLAAFICFAVETWRTRSLTTLGLALWVLVYVIGAWPN